MGNVLQPQSGHVLELRLFPPHVEPPLGSQGQRCVLFARVGTFEDRTASSSALWDEPVTVFLPSNNSAALISLYAAEPGQRSLEEAYADGAATFLAELALPYSGVGGLAQLGVSVDGPAVQLQLALAMGERCRCTTQEQLCQVLHYARERFRLDMPCMALSVREVSAVGSIGGPTKGEEWKLPPLRRQVVALELQNEALRRRRHELSQRGGAEVDQEPTTVPMHVQQLQRIQEENEQLRSEKAGMSQKLEHTRSLMSGVQEQPQSQDGTDWGRTLRVMQQELTHCRERQRKIKANYEDRLQGLQGQLQQALKHIAEAEAGAAPALTTEVEAMQRRIDDATARRDDLMRQLTELREKAAMRPQSATDLKTSQAGNPEIERLLEISEQNKAELAGLQQELALQHEQEKGPEDQQELRGAVEQLYEELDELHRAQEDERVRSESEVRELKIERDAIKDKLDDAMQELQHLRAKAEALRALRAEQSADGPVPMAAELEQLRAQNETQAAELEQLLRQEADRTKAIRDLELEQETMVEKISLITAQALPLAERCDDPAEYAKALESKAATLQQQLEDTEQACEVQRAQVETLRTQAAEAKARSVALQESYNSLQQLSDERVLRSPDQQRGN